MNPIKTFQVKGDLYEGQFSVAFCSEYLLGTIGNWQICFSDISYQFNNPSSVTDIFHISTNLVTAHYFDANGRSIKTNPILQKFQLVPYQKPTLITFNPHTWFAVNAPNDLLKVFVKSWTNSKLKKDLCAVQITVLMARIN